MIINIGQGSPFEVLLGIVFVALVFLIFFGTLFVFGAYVLGNLRDKWPEQTSQQRFIQMSKYSLYLGVFCLVVWLAIKQMPA